MSVGIVEGILKHYAGIDNLVEEILRRVLLQRHVDVGHDATTAVDSLASRRDIFQRVGEMNAIGAEHLARFVSVVSLENVFLLVAVVWFLDATSRRGVIPCHRESQSCSVAEVKLLLHQAFAERTASDDGSSVVVLKRAGHYLGG